MPLNPALREETLNNPIQRGNPLNDPKYQEQQGYNTYDLNNTQLCSPRFGEVTPIEVFETVPGDRHFVHGNSLSFLNQIDANLVSRINEYHDYFYVPMRCMYPVNYEKIIPNPTKGDDVPNSALPMIPLLSFFRQLLSASDYTFRARFGGDVVVDIGAQFDLLFNVSRDYRDPDASSLSYYAASSYVPALNALIYVAYALSRGQLLDYLGYSLGVSSTNDVDGSNIYRSYKEPLQAAIDDFFQALAAPTINTVDNGSDGDLLEAPYRVVTALYGLDNVSDDPDTDRYVGTSAKVVYRPTRAEDWRLDSFRAALYDALEKGLFIYPQFYSTIPVDGNPGTYDYDALRDVFSIGVAIAASKLYNIIFEIVTAQEYRDPSELDALDDPFTVMDINPMRVLAYQMSVAEYMSNDSVDNIYTADLYMQNIRAIMFPSVNGVTSERTFNYNGVDTEYDLFTYGAFDQAFMRESSPSYLSKFLRFTSSVFFMRRSLRYGDYFATGRPDLLAVGQLGIPAANNIVQPIDVTRNLVLQRFLNAVNWIGSRFVNYIKGIFGVKPSDTGSHPIFVAHRKVELDRNLVNNTAQDQGKQTTNLLGKSDAQAFDVFIDDFGIVIGVCSFDALPVYPAGIDANFRNSDRFSMFNPMLQNVGDQPIRLVELTGDILKDPEASFAYMVRYAQYKFGMSRAHGAFVNSLPGFAMLYPAVNLGDDPEESAHINPEFIRDKPYYFDQFFASRTGVSPGTYYHFIVSVQNTHSAARKMQYQPPVL